MKQNAESGRLIIRNYLRKKLNNEVGSVLIQ